MEVTSMLFSAGERELLCGMIGRKLERFRCDDGCETGAGICAWGVVGLCVGDEVFAFLREERPVKRCGVIDDWPVTRLERASSFQITSRLVGVKQRDWLIGQIINDIRVYEDSEFRFEEGIDLYRYDYTSAVLFQLERTQLVLSCSDMVESVDIYQGPHAEKSVRPVSLSIDESEIDEYRVERRVVSLKEASKR